MLELAQREVYAHYRGRIARAPLLPFARLTAGLLQHPLSDGNDKPGLLRKGDELGGVHHAALGVVPTQEGFHPGDGIAYQREHWLIVNLEFVAFDGLPEAVLQTQALQGLRVLTPVEDLVAGLVFVFRSV